MSNLNIKRFVEVLQKSKLIPRETLRETLLACKRDHNDRIPRDPSEVARYLIAARLLTRWQCKKLLAGKYKGFYLGVYKLLDHIGSGGMSSVYLAEHSWLQQPRAIKVFPRHRVGEASYLARFEQEARATASLNHPHIVRTYDFDSQGSTYYMVMEYVSGQDLASLVQLHSQLDCEAVACYMAQAARGLHHAHDQGFIHRDVKPANLLVDERGVAKILDLGLALISGSSLTLTHNENVLGSADYLAPEQAVNSHEVDRRADVYGLGCTMYFALTGYPPFRDGTVAQRIIKHQTKMPPAIADDRPDCPRKLADVCVKMVQKNPNERYQNCLEVSEILERWLARQHNEPISRARFAATSKLAADGFS